MQFNLNLKQVCSTANVIMQLKSKSLRSHLRWSRQKHYYQSQCLAHQSV